MPRNSAGTYTLPAGNPVVAGTTIDASWANDTMSDMANEITNSLSRTGAGGMLAPFRVADGSVTAPGLGFTNETNTGLYRSGSGEVWFTVGGVAVAQITGNGLLLPSGKRITLPTPVNATDGANKQYVDDQVAPVIGYADFYLGPKSSDPTVNNSGGALTEGTTYWSTTLDQMRVYNGSNWVPMPSTASLQGQTFSGDGVDTTFTLAAPTGNATNLEVFISGVRQTPTTDYTVSGTTLTFTTAPPSGTDNIYVRFAQLIAMASADSSNVSYLPAGTGAVATTVQTKLRETVSVLDFGADPTGVADSTAAIQGALTAGAGKRVHVPAGTYMVNQGLVINSNTLLYGDGDGSVIKANPTYIGVNGGTYATQTCQMIRNANFAASSLTDSDITVESLTFDWGSVTIVGGGAHSIAMRYVDRVTIRNVRNINGENCTALLACRDTFTENCHATNAKNCGFDHWDGAGNAMVAFCTVRNSGTNNNQGIQFTGTGSFGENAASVDCVVMGCSVYGVRGPTGSASAIISNANDNGSQTYRFRSIGNYVEDCDMGVVFEGEGGQHLSMGDTLRSVDNLPIFVQFSSPHAPAHCRILDAHLIDCDHTPGNVALVSLAGTDNAVRGLRVTNTASAAYAVIVWLTTNAFNNIVEIEKADTGSGVRVYDQGTNSFIADQPYTDWQTYTPTISATTGTITTATGSGRFKKVGRRVYFYASANITNNGTGAGTLLISLPETSQAANNVFGVGRDSTTGTLCLWFNASTSNAYVLTTGGAYPGATGRVINISGVYEAA